MDRENYQTAPQDRLSPEERALRVKKLKRKRKIRLAIVVVAFLIVIAAVLSPIVIFTAFRVSAIDVQGDTVYTDDEIFEASGIKEGDNLLFVDVTKPKALIEAALPYAANVQITKKLPHTLVIRIETAKQEYAVEISKGTYAITDASFKVLEHSGVVPEGVTPVEGPAPIKYQPGTVLSFSDNSDTDASLELITEISDSIAKYGYEDVNLISISTNTNIYIIYNERLLLRLGDSSNIESKLSLAKRIIEDCDAPDKDAVGGTESVPVTGVINLTVHERGFLEKCAVAEVPELAAYLGIEESAKPEPDEDDSSEDTDEEKSESESQSEDSNPDDSSETEE